MSMTRSLALATLATIAPLALSACAVIPDAPLVSGTPWPQGSAVALMQPVKVGDLVVTPREVVEDSRCPINARCVWAGKLTVSTRIAATHWAQTAPLTLGEPYEVMGRTYVLAAATPGQTTDREIPAGEYRFTFEKR